MILIYILMSEVDARTHAPSSHSLTPPIRLLPEPDCEGDSIRFIPEDTSNAC
jgi:hypothetical protein